MHAADSSRTPSPPPKSATPAPSGGPGNRTPRRGPSKGLWIALAVIVVVVAVAAVIYFWYLPSRDTDEMAVAPSDATSGSVPTDGGEGTTLTEAQATDDAAMALVRTAMSAIESAYVNSSTGTYDPAVVTPEMLSAIAPTITFNPWSSPAASSEATAKAELNAVDYAGDDLNFAVGTVSKTGRVFGVVVTREDDGATWYYVDGNETDWNAYTAATPLPAGDSTGVASTPGLHEDPILGCSFEYPVDWVTYDYQLIHGSLSNDPSVFIVGDPSTAPTPIPLDFIEFSGSRTPGETAPSAREAAEYQATRYAEGQRTAGQQLPVDLGDEFFVEETINGISACSISYLTMDGMDEGDAPQYWIVYCLAHEDTSFLLQFVTTATRAEANDAVFRAVLDSFRITKTNE